MGKARTLFMHTLDGRPAYSEHGGVYFAGIGRPVQLVPTLARIRREQRESQATATVLEWRNPKRYGYLRVKVSR